MTQLEEDKKTSGFTFVEGKDPGQAIHETYGITLNEFYNVMKQFSTFREVLARIAVPRTENTADLEVLSGKAAKLEGEEYKTHKTQFEDSLTKAILDDKFHEKVQAIQAHGSSTQRSSLVARFEASKTMHEQSARTTGDSLKTIAPHLRTVRALLKSGALDRVLRRTSNKENKPPDDGGSNKKRR